MMACPAGCADGSICRQGLALALPETRRGRRLGGANVHDRPVVCDRCAMIVTLAAQVPFIAVDAHISPGCTKWHAVNMIQVRPQD